MTTVEMGQEIGVKHVRMVCVEAAGSLDAAVPLWDTRSTDSC